ncbi:hypothetical protein [uncultured Psychroserpens sp.]|uniref:hypothetical protein n=1 Tax=uncultured Psychroserpens sp. TaxID=255436 RepID=UPI00261B5AE5|nr:hypothetical protein [uncultured Psychroserpens sp.]
METFEEKLINSFKGSIDKSELKKTVIDFLLEKIVQEAVEYDRNKGTDLKLRAKSVTNSLIAKGEEIKL